MTDHLRSQTVIHSLDPEFRLNTSPSLQDVDRLNPFDSTLQTTFVIGIVNGGDHCRTNRHEQSETHALSSLNFVLKTTKLDLKLVHEIPNWSH